MVYIWNKDGQVVFHTDKKFAVEVEKLPSTPDLEMSEEEFYAKQPIRIVDGKFTFGKTEEELSQEEAVTVRAKRDYLINEVQWRVYRYLEQKAAGETTADTEAKFKKISAYVKALRDIPAQKGFPFEVTWPTLEV